MVSLVTEWVWFPCKEASREISRHHNRDEIRVIKMGRYIRGEDKLFFFSPNTKDEASIREDREVIMGHGLGDVR